MGDCLLCRVSDGAKDTDVSGDIFVCSIMSIFGIFRTFSQLYSFPITPYNIDIMNEDDLEQFDTSRLVEPESADG